MTILPTPVPSPTAPVSTPVGVDQGWYAYFQYQSITTAANANAIAGNSADIAVLKELTASQPANEFFASPASGAGAPAFRKLVAADLPSLDGQYPGTTTNDNANAGNIGEYVSVTVPTGSAVALTSGAIADLMSISLTAGDWDVWANVAVSTTGTITAAAAWINTTSATDPTTPNGGAYSSSTGLLQGPVGTMRQSLASTTTVYMSMRATFTGGTAGGFGFLGARRAR